MFLPHLMKREPEPVSVGAVAQTIVSGIVPDPPSDDFLKRAADPVNAPATLSTGTVVVASFPTSAVTFFSPQGKPDGELTSAEYEEHCEIIRQRRKQKQDSEFAEMNRKREQNPPSESFLPAETATDPDNETVADFEDNERRVIEFGQTLERDRIAVLNGHQYEILCSHRGFEVDFCPPSGPLQTWTTGRNGFEFSTFARVVDYCVQYARERNHVDTFHNENGCTIERRYHTKLRTWVHVVALPNSLSSAEFKREETRCKQAGGWYARQYKPAFQRGGFMFYRFENARRFAAEYSR